MIINNKKKDNLSENDIVLRTTDGVYCKFVCCYDTDIKHTRKKVYYFKHFNDRGGFLVHSNLMYKMFEAKNTNLCIFREADYLCE